MRRKSGANQIRITGGQWRGRKLEFPSIDGLRPTGDRVRETLFNWLGQNLDGLAVLDLFAGSGALGIEALSRGADSADFVETSGMAYRAIEQSLTKLSAQNALLHQQPAQDFLASSRENTFDIVFIDPPFSNNLHREICQAVAEARVLKQGALIYVESPAVEEIGLPSQWLSLKSKRIGDVLCQLLQTDC